MYCGLRVLARAEAPTRGRRFIVAGIGQSRAARAPRACAGVVRSAHSAPPAATEPVSDALPHATSASWAASATAKTLSINRPQYADRKGRVKRATWAAYRNFRCHIRLETDPFPPRCAD